MIVAPDHMTTQKREIIKFAPGLFYIKGEPGLTLVEDLEWECEHVLEAIEAAERAVHRARDKEREARG